MLINVFINDIDNDIGYSLRKLADDIKLCVAVDSLGGRDAIHRDPDRIEEWVCVNLMRFNKANYTCIGAVPSISADWGMN